MATDTRCPVCGTALLLGKGAAARVPLEARAAFDPSARREFFFRRWVVFPVMAVLGLAAIAGGVVMYLNTQEDHSVARNVTAADLLRVEKPGDLPDWISYSPTRVIDTDVVYVKTMSRQVTRKFFLLAAGDHWVLAEVNGQFKGSRFEGKLAPFNTEALPKVAAAHPDKAAHLLPYQLEAKLDIAGTQRAHYFQAGFLALFGLLLSFTGVRGVFVKPPPFVGAAKEEPVLAAPREPAYRMIQQPVLQPTYQAAPQPICQPERQPRRRGLVVRAFFGFLWAVVFFAGAAVLATWLAVHGAADDPEVCNQLAQEAGQKQGPLLLLGSLVLATVLGCLGWLPGTRKR
jgi:hypothetical protein